MKNFSSKKLKRLLAIYKSIDLKRREQSFEANDCDKFYSDAEYRCKMAKLEQIVFRMYHSYWRKSNLDLKLSNQLFDAISYLGNYDIEPILKTIYEYYKNLEAENDCLEAIDYFTKKGQFLDIVGEAIAGDKSAQSMLAQEYNYVKKLAIKEVSNEIELC